MKFVERGHYADPDIAARKLVEIANGVEAMQDVRIHIEKINAPFLCQHKGTPAEYKGGPRPCHCPWLVDAHLTAEPFCFALDLWLCPLRHLAKGRQRALFLAATRILGHECRSLR